MVMGFDAPLATGGVALVKTADGADDFRRFSSACTPVAVTRTLPQVAAVANLNRRVKAVDLLQCGPQLLGVGDARLDVVGGGDQPPHTLAHAVHRRSARRAA